MRIDVEEVATYTDELEVAEEGWYENGVRVGEMKEDDEWEGPVRPRRRRFGIKDVFL